jgi:1-acyl-sn-glycerol-3-phosphate acyltransferase
MVMPVFIALTLVYAWREEQGLIRRFGARYARYRRETPLIIPRLPNVLRLPGALLFKMLFGLTVNGRENIPEESPFVVVSTHRCYLDPFFIGVAVPKPIHFVTTFEVFRKRRTAWLFRRFLSEPRKRFRADTESQRAVARLIRDKGIVGLFAEGERSWTGSPQPFKPEAIRFLTLFDGLLVLPIRIDGNFSAWPRWAPRFHKAKVTVTVQEALRMGKGMTAAILEKNLLAATMPHDSESRCRGKASARGITAVLYRCPECKVFRSLEAHDAHAVLCAACGAKLSVSPCCRISWSSAGKWDDLELDEAYQRIRITEADMASARELQGTGPGLSDGSLMNIGTLSIVSTAARAGIFRLEPGEMLVAGASAVRFSRESGRRFNVTGARSLMLTDRRLLAFGDTLAADVALDALSSVTTESNRKLQLYDERQRHLYQAEFAEDSVLLWQDCIVAAVRFFFGRSVNTR